MDYSNIASSLESGSDASGSRMIGIAFSYKNKTEETVRWDNEMMECNCDFFVNDREVGHIKDMLRSYRDKFLITISKDDFAKIEGGKGKVMCRMNPTGRNLEASKRISLK